MCVAVCIVHMGSGAVSIIACTCGVVQRWRCVDVREVWVCVWLWVCKWLVMAHFLGIFLPLDRIEGDGMFAKKHFLTAMPEDIFMYHRLGLLKISEQFLNDDPYMPQNAYWINMCRHSLMSFSIWLNSNNLHPMPVHSPPWWWLLWWLTQPKRVVCKPAEKKCIDIEHGD